MTFGICFWIHTPRLCRTPLIEGTRGGGPSVVTWWNMEKYVIMEHRKKRKTRLWACVTGFWYVCCMSKNTKITIMTFLVRWCYNYWPMKKSNRCFGLVKSMWLGRWVWEHETMKYGGIVDINNLRICILLYWWYSKWFNVLRLAWMK